MTLNLRRLSLRVEYNVLRRVVMILDLGTLWFLGNGLVSPDDRTLSFFAMLACFVGSYELGYPVQCMLVRLELRGQENALSE